MSPWSDERRLAKVGAALLLLAAMGGYYAWFATTQVRGWRWCLEDPVARDGYDLVFPLWTVTKVVGPDRYEISKAMPDIPVLGDARALKVGDTVSVMGDFSAERRAVVETVREVHTLRRWKEGLGVLGFLVVAAMAPFFFRREGGRLVERRWRT